MKNILLAAMSIGLIDSAISKNIASSEIKRFSINSCNINLVLSKYIRDFDPDSPQNKDTCLYKYVYSDKPIYGGSYNDSGSKIYLEGHGDKKNETYYKATVLPASEDALGVIRSAALVNRLGIKDPSAKIFTEDFYTCEEQEYFAGYIRHIRYHHEDCKNGLLNDLIDVGFHSKDTATIVKSWKLPNGTECNKIAVLNNGHIIFNNFPVAYTGRRSDKNFSILKPSTTAVFEIDPNKDDIKTYLSYGQLGTSARIEALDYDYKSNTLYLISKEAHKRIYSIALDNLSYKPRQIKECGATDTAINTNEYNSSMESSLQNTYATDAKFFRNRLYLYEATSNNRYDPSKTALIKLNPDLSCLLRSYKLPNAMSDWGFGGRSNNIKHTVLKTRAIGRTISSLSYRWWFRILGDSKKKYFSNKRNYKFMYCDGMSFIDQGYTDTGIPTAVLILHSRSNFTKTNIPAYNFI